MREERHDAHVMEYHRRKSIAEADAQKQVMEALEGMNSDQIRRTLNAVSGLLDLDIRIPVPRDG